MSKFVKGDIIYLPNDTRTGYEKFQINYVGNKDYGFKESTRASQDYVDRVAMITPPIKGEVSLVEEPIQVQVRGNVVIKGGKRKSRKNRKSRKPRRKSQRRK